jgi:hypothetical protein
LFLAGRWREGESTLAWGPQLGWEACGAEWKLVGLHALERQGRHGSGDDLRGAGRVWQPIHTLDLGWRVARNSAVHLQVRADGAQSGALSWQQFY